MRACELKPQNMQAVVNKLEKYLRAVTEGPSIKDYFDRERVLNPTRWHQIRFGLTILKEIKVLMQAGRMDRAFGWIRFLHGILWCVGILTVEEMRTMNDSLYDPEIVPLLPQLQPQRGKLR